jgi:hypothetical protein
LAFFLLKIVMIRFCSVLSKKMPNFSPLFAKNIIISVPGWRRCAVATRPNQESGSWVRIHPRRKVFREGMLLGNIDLMCIACVFSWEIKALVQIFSQQKLSSYFLHKYVSGIRQIFYSARASFDQGCQMVYFQAKNPNWCKFCRALKLKMLAIYLYGHLEYFTAIWYIWWPFGTVSIIWYIFPRFGISCKEKSGTPAFDTRIKVIGRLLPYREGLVLQWRTFLKEETDKGYVHMYIC